MSSIKSQIVDWFVTNFPNEVEKMQLCSHTHSNGSLNPYHQEGSVWTHTQMVVDLVETTPELVFAALLHDIGKPETRYEKENGRVSFRSHECVSLVKSISILERAQSVFQFDRLATLQLIAWHGTLWSNEPLELCIKQVDHCYGSCSSLLKQLVSFVRADMYGREYAASVQHEIDAIDSRLDTLENYTPYNHTLFRQEKPLNAVFLVGLSGSGKSTYRNQHYANSDYRAISVDDYFYQKAMGYGSVVYEKNIKRAHSASIANLLDAVNKRQNILVDMTNLTAESRGKKLVKIPSTQYNYKAVVFLKGIDTIHQNLKKRGYKQIPDSVLQRQIAQFELPDLSEFNSIEYVMEN